MLLVDTVHEKRLKLFRIPLVCPGHSFGRRDNPPELPFCRQNNSRSALRFISYLLCRSTSHTAWWTQFIPSSSAPFQIFPTCATATELASPTAAPYSSFARLMLQSLIELRKASFYWWNAIPSFGGRKPSAENGWAWLQTQARKVVQTYDDTNEMILVETYPQGAVCISTAERRISADWAQNLFVRGKHTIRGKRLSFRCTRVRM